jgi:hypothetical protein
MKFLFCFMLMAFATLSYSEIFDRACRPLEELGGAMTGFEPEKYLGKWFEIER